MKLSLVLTLVTGAAAFAPSRNAANIHARNQVLSRPITALNVAAPNPVETSIASAPEPDMIDEGVYTFNKILIDTVYNIICFFYPVTGTKRDFARFYVLETVARV
jgi:hypothetical protein